LSDDAPTNPDRYQKRTDNDAQTPQAYFPFHQPNAPTGGFAALVRAFAQSGGMLVVASFAATPTVPSRGDISESAQDPCQLIQAISLPFPSMMSRLSGYQHVI
jgi:hypothetical protein